MIHKLSLISSIPNFGHGLLSFKSSLDILDISLFAFAKWSYSESTANKNECFHFLLQCKCLLALCRCTCFYAIKLFMHNLQIFIGWSIIYLQKTCCEYFYKVNENFLIKANLYILGGQFGLTYTIYFFLKVEHHCHVSKAFSFMPWVFLLTLIRNKKELVVRWDQGK